MSNYFTRLVTASLALALSGCGSQITSLRSATKGIRTSASAILPDLTSVTILDSSPTNRSPLTLDFGIIVGSPTHYCILENSTNATSCIWHAGVPPTTYTDISPDGPFTITILLKNDFGQSIPVVSNTVTLDRTPPGLASVAVGNSDPTNNSTFSLSYGAITNAPYSHFCIQENNIFPAGCIWVPGTVPSSFGVSNTSGSKAISVWLRDLAGNISTRVTTAAITYDATVPTVSFATPLAGAYANAANYTAFAISGACSDNGRNVVISGAASATVVCTGGAWNTTVDLTATGPGAFSLHANLTNLAGSAAIQASRGFVKDIIAPTLAIGSPAAGAYANAANVASFPISGTCSEETRSVTITGDATASPTCTSGTWSANLNFSAAAPGPLSITVNHSDAAGNAAPAVVRGFVKDVLAPTLSILTPSAGAVINSVNMGSITISGACSENTRSVTISGSVTGSATCTAGAWTLDADFSSVSDGPVTIYANHSDAAGNPAVQASVALTKASGIPAVAILLPAAGSYVNATNVASFPVSGTCSESGQNVVVSGDASATIVCTAGAWSTNLNFTAAAPGTVSINVNHSDASSNPAPQVSRSFVKDVAAPSVAISLPAAGSFVNAAHVSGFAVSGTCSEDGQNVVISGAATATLTCALGVWSTNLNFSAAAAGSVSISVNHSDVAGNAATTATRNFNKDVIPPSVAILVPSTGAYATAANAAAFPISGTCSENGQNISISGAGTAVVACSAGTWSTTVDVSAAGEGARTLFADHSDAAGNPAPQDDVAFTKDVGVPLVAISTPIAGSYINASNVATFSVTGTCSENTRNVVITGSASLTTVCTAGAWSANLDFTSASDGSVTINVNHQDIAGNPAVQDSRNFTKDVTRPTLASMAITNTSPTSNMAYSLTYGAQTGTFAEYCVLENSTAVAGCSGNWVTSSTLPSSFTVAATEISKSLSIWLRDAAGNVSTTVTSGAVTLDTTAPVVTLTSFDAGQAIVGNTLQSITATATDTHLTASPISTAYSIDGGATWVPIQSGVSNGGAYPWTSPNSDQAQVRVRVTAVDSAGNSGSDISSVDFAVDTTAPVFAASLMQLNGGTSPTLSNYIPVEFTANDPTSLVTHYCLKYNSTVAPAANASCWIAVSPIASYAAAVNYRLGFSSGAYTVYAWAKNGAGLVSALTNTLAGTTDQDKAAITFTPVAPPLVTGVTASSSDVSVNLTIPASQTVYIKWDATSSGTLTANPISIYYTTDDTDYTLIANNVPNAQGAGCTLAGTETGCYTWTTSSPTSAYYRIRVGAIDTNNRQSFQSTQPLNVATSLRVLAGVTDPGTEGSAEAAVFMTNNMTSSYSYPGNLLVSTDGVVYFNDTTRGILQVDPVDGVQRLVIRKTGVSTDGSTPLTATVRRVVRMSFDSAGRVLIFDYDRIRRYDPVANTVSTIIGTGGSTAATVAPLALSMTNVGTSNVLNPLLMGTPDGKIYFQSQAYTNTTPAGGYNLRVLDPAANLGVGEVTTISFSGTGNDRVPGQNIALCTGAHISGEFDPLTGAIQNFFLHTRHNSAGCTTSPIDYGLSVIDPATRQPRALQMATSVSSAFEGFVVGANGMLYRINRPGYSVHRFDRTTTSYVLVLGGGTNGSCPDGTLATACNADISDAYADANGQFYYLERGKIRTIDQAGNVQTVMGSGLSAGDGGLAKLARLGAASGVSMWTDGVIEKAVFVDQTQFRIREFTIDGNIQTIAGNGSHGSANTTASAVGQPLYYAANGGIDSLYIAVHPTNGTVYTGNRTFGRISKLDRSTSIWSDLVGGGADRYYSATSNGKIGSLIDLFTSYTPSIIGFDGSSKLLVHKRRFSSSAVRDVFLKTYAISNGLQTHVAGIEAPAASGFSVDGTAGASTVVSDQTQGATWDAYASRWVFGRDSPNSVIRTQTEGGAISTVATLPSNQSSFAYRHDASNDIIYYCDSASGEIVKYNVATLSSSTLTWPITKMKCSGTGMHYSASRNSLIFPFQQDGLGGIAEYLNP